MSVGLNCMGAIYASIVFSFFDFDIIVITYAKIKQEGQQQKIYAISRKIPFMGSFKSGMMYNGIREICLIWETSKRRHTYKPLYKYKAKNTLEQHVTLYLFDKKMIL